MWYQGITGLEWWQSLLVVLGMTHVTIVAVTVYLHRFSAHRALELHPAVQHVFRFWLWLSTGMSTRSWTAIHRKHHAFCETVDDPHSPVVLGLGKVMREGAELYRAADTAETREKFGKGTPDDFMERRVYRHTGLGIALMFALDLLLFGVAGISVWAIQMGWIPFFAAGVINGVGHALGYRNFEIPSAATNIVPWGILIGGEELHNNHHTFPASPKLSVKPWEFDMGWFWIRVLQGLRPRRGAALQARGHARAGQARDRRQHRLGRDRRPLPDHGALHRPGDQAARGTGARTRRWRRAPRAGTREKTAEP